MPIQLPPGPDLSSLANRIWALIDERVNELVRVSMNAWGTSRPRPLTVVFPLADASGPPAVGWLQSVPIWFPSRITAWEIHALTAGEIVLDIQVSTIQASPATAPTLTSLNGPLNYLSLNGYTTSSIDTSAWLKRDISAGSVLSVYVISASGISEAVLGLQLTDLESRVLQT